MLHEHNTYCVNLNRNGVTVRADFVRNLPIEDQMRIRDAYQVLNEIRLVKGNFMECLIFLTRTVSRNLP